MGGAGGVGQGGVAGMGGVGQGGVAGMGGAGGGGQGGGTGGVGGAGAGGATSSGGGAGQGGSGGSGGAPLSVCGDGFVGAGETCDDGNTVPNDGCDAACLLESGTVCGDSVNLSDPNVAVKNADLLTYNGSTLGSGLTDFGDPSCSDGTAGILTVLHRYTTGALPARLRVETKETIGNLKDTVVWVYKDCLNTSSELACDDDSGPATYSDLKTGVMAPYTTVFIAVSGYSAADTGAYTLMVWETPVTVVPASGSCAAPVPIAAGSYAGETLISDPNNLSAAACFTGMSAPEAVYELSIAAKSDIRVQLAPDSPALDLGLYLRASPCAAGMELACAEDTGVGLSESMELKDAPPGTYYIVVDGYTSLDVGPYGMSVDTIAVLPPGAPCDPQSLQSRCETGLSCAGPAMGAVCAAANTIFYEDFSMGLGAFSTGDAGSDGLTWTYCNPFAGCQHDNTTGSLSSAGFALVHDDNNVIHDGEMLVTPPLSALGYNFVALQFDHNFDHLESSSDLARVELSTNMMIWTPVADFTGDAAGRVYLDLSPMAAGQTFWLRFVFDDQSSAQNPLVWVNDWRLDDVRVLGL